MVSNHSEASAEEAQVRPAVEESSPVSVALQALVAVAAVLLFFTSADLYAANAWGMPLPSIWGVVFAAAAAVIGAVQPERVARLVRSPFFAWALGFFCLTTVSGIFIRNVPGVPRELLERYRALALMLALAILFQEPRVRRAALLAVAAGVGLACVLNLAESFNLVRFVEDPGRVPGRSAGLYVNANMSGAYIVCGLAVCTAAIPRRARLPLLLAGAAGVALTFSRGAALCFALLLLVLAATRVIKVGALLGTLLVSVAVLVYFSPDISRALDRAGVLNRNTLSRLSLERDDSGRINLARRAWEEFTESPLVGNGLASTIDWDAPEQPHNEYLFLAADHGVLGLLVFPALALALVTGTRAAIPLSAVLLLTAFFSHNLLTSRSAIVVVALMAAAASDGTPSRRRRQG